MMLTSSYTDDTVEKALFLIYSKHAYFLVDGYFWVIL